GIKRHELLIIGLILLKAIAVGDVGDFDTRFFRQHTGKLGISHIFTKQPLRMEVALLVIALAFDLFITKFKAIDFTLAKLMTVMNLRQSIHFSIGTHGKQPPNTDKV